MAMPRSGRRCSTGSLPVLTCAAKVEINDFGATPGTVTLRLEQAAEEVRS